MVHCIAPEWQKKTKFDCIFNFNVLWLRHLEMQRQSRRRVHIYKPSPIHWLSKPFLSSNGLMAKSRSQTLLFNKHDRQKHQTFLPPQRGRGQSPSLSVLGTVTEEVHTIYVCCQMPIISKFLLKYNSGKGVFMKMGSDCSVHLVWNTVCNTNTSLHGKC